MSAICGAVAYGAEPPVVTSVTPESGAATGQENVTIRGSGFAGSESVVEFGTQRASIGRIASATMLVVKPPVGSGTVPVTVTTAAGTSAVGPADHFSYIPAVTGVSPAIGPATGGTAVEVKGAGLDEATAVRFGSVPAKSFTVNSPSSITAVSPQVELPGPLDVTVTGATGTSALIHDRFRYLPAITGLNPDAGSTEGGELITVTGGGFALGGATTIKFGSTLAQSVNCTSSTRCEVRTPRTPEKHTRRHVRATVNGFSSALTTADEFRFVPPQALHLVEADTLARVAEGRSVEVFFLVEDSSKEICSGSGDGEVTVNVGLEVAVRINHSISSYCSGPRTQTTYGAWAAFPSGGAYDFDLTYTGHASMPAAAGLYGIYQPEGECAYEAEELSGRWLSEIYEADVEGTFQLVEGQPECASTLQEHGFAQVYVTHPFAELLVLKK